jgi:hypothetical protein
MYKTNCRGARAGPRLALRFCFLGLFLILSTTAFAGGPTIWVAPPNGVDDTADIQATLNACVAQGPGCTVQLQAGTYFTKQLVVYNFQGTFKGMGQSRTIIEALPNLLVEIEPVGGIPESVCQANTTTCLFPDLILFVDGDIHVSDLSIFENAPPGTATTPWNFAGGGPYIGLFDLLTFTGQHLNAYVDRIHVEGLPDPTNFAGFNVVNGVHFTGTFPRSLTPLDWYFLSGSFTVRNSSFKGTFDGISQDGFVRSSHITVGGSPTTGNHLEGLYAGIDMESLEGSFVEISHNESSGIGAGMWVVPWFNSVYIPSSPSRYLIHDNKFIGTAQNAAGFYFFNEPAHPWIEAAAWNNIVELRDSLSEGIGAYNTQGTAIWDNSVTGTDGYAAVGLFNSTLSTAVHNNVSDFTVDSSAGTAQIYLDPLTTKDLVVCAEPSDTVLNQGTDNVVIGCQQPTATPAATENVAPTATVPGPRLPKGKPWRH